MGPEKGGGIGAMDKTPITGGLGQNKFILWATLTTTVTMYLGHVGAHDCTATGKGRGGNMARMHIHRRCLRQPAEGGITFMSAIALPDNLSVH